MKTIQKALLSVALVGITSSYAGDQGRFDPQAALRKLEEHRRQSQLAIRGNVQELQRRNIESERETARRMDEAARRIQKYMGIQEFEARELVRNLDAARHRFELDVERMTDINAQLSADLANYRAMLQDARQRGEAYYNALKEEIRGNIEEYMKVYRDSQEDVKRQIEDMMRTLEEVG